jgi:PPE-repeat protein
VDWAALPPEINSGLMCTGPESGPMLGGLGRARRRVVLNGVVLRLGDLRPREGVAGAVIDIDGGRGDPLYVVDHRHRRAGRCHGHPGHCRRGMAAYEAAFAMTVPPPVIAANRALLMALIATNFFGQKTPAIMATEAQYTEMWAQDAAAMFGYAGASQTILSGALGSQRPHPAHHLRRLSILAAPGPRLGSTWSPRRSTTSPMRTTSAR